MLLALFVDHNRRHRRVGKGGRGVTVEHGVCSAVPTTALLVGTAGLVPRINR
jgi:hypothetical protein